MDTRSWGSPTISIGIADDGEPGEASWGYRAGFLERKQMMMRSGKPWWVEFDNHGKTAYPDWEPAIQYVKSPPEVYWQLPKWDKLYGDPCKWPGDGTGWNIIWFGNIKWKGIKLWFCREHMLQASWGQNSWVLSFGREHKVIPLQDSFLLAASKHELP